MVVKHKFLNNTLQCCGAARTTLIIVILHACPCCLQVIDLEGKKNRVPLRDGEADMTEEHSEEAVDTVDTEDSYIDEIIQDWRQEEEPGIKQLGEPCTLANECESGNCVDDVCCDSECSGGICQRCDSYSVNGPGHCGYVSGAGEDPDSDCDQGTTIGDGCRSDTCSGTDYSCGILASSDGGCPLCSTCTGSIFECHYYSSGERDNGCDACKACSGSESGSCTRNLPNTSWGEDMYGCSGTDTRCFEGVCRTCGGTLHPDGCGGCAGQGANACWYLGLRYDSCDTTCVSGCVQADWNDDIYCTLCIWFVHDLTGETPTICESRERTHAPYWWPDSTEDCRYRTGPQDCSVVCDSRRLCVCNY